MVKNFFTSNSRAFVLTFMLLFTLGSAAYFIGTEWLLQVHVIPKDNMIKRAKLFHKQESLNILIGDSQLRDGVNFLPGFVNLSAGSQKYGEMELKVLKYYDDADEPFKIILHGAINGFAKYRDKPSNKYVYEFYLHDNTDPPFILTNYYQSRAFLYWNNFIKNKGRIITYEHHYNKDGSTTRFGNVSTWSDKELAVKLAHTKNQYIPLPAPKKLAAYRSLVNMLKFLQSKDAQVCLVVPPYHERLKQDFIHEPRVVEVLNIFKDLSARYGARYVNYLDDKLPAHYFNDLSHVNKRGAKYITDTIAKQCF